MLGRGIDVVARELGLPARAVAMVSGLPGGSSEAPAPPPVAQASAAPDEPAVDETPEPPATEPTSPPTTAPPEDPPSTSPEPGPEPEERTVELTVGGIGWLTAYLGRSAATSRSRRTSTS